MMPLAALRFVGAWDAADGGQRSRLLTGLIEGIETEMMEDGRLRLVAVPKVALKRFLCIRGIWSARRGSSLRVPRQASSSFTAWPRRPDRPLHQSGRWLAVQKRQRFESIWVDPGLQRSNGGFNRWMQQGADGTIRWVYARRGALKSAARSEYPLLGRWR